MALLALADELCLESLRAACSEMLIECLISANAAQLQEAAERYNAPELLAAARSITTAESNALGDLIARKRSLQSRLDRHDKLQVDQKNIKDELHAQMRAIDDQHAQEIEQLFRNNQQAAWTSLEDGFPHAAGKVLCVVPNANNPYGWIWDGDFRPWPVSDDENAQPAAKRAKIGRGGGKKQKAAPPPRVMYKSIMEALAAAAPGDVVKLLAGRHLLTSLDKRDKPCWDNVYRKSVQIVADDGLASDRVLVGIAQYEGGIMAKRESAIAVMNADVRIAGVTLLCTGENVRTGYLGVYEGGRLWLENCSIRLSSSSPERYMRERPQYDDEDDVNMADIEKPEFAHGVAVGPGAACFIRGCVIDGAGGAGVQIAPSATRVVVESSTITGCASGSTRITHVGAWNLAGECGAVEIEAWKQQDTDDTHTSGEASVQVVLRKCQIMGNLGPGVSVRLVGNIEAATALAARIRLEDCTVSGNYKESRVRTVAVGEDNAVVWNKTRRGTRYKQSLRTATLSDDDDYW
jgi:hypothetical protein